MPWMTIDGASSRLAASPVSKIDPCPIATLPVPARTCAPEPMAIPPALPTTGELTVADEPSAREKSLVATAPCPNAELFRPLPDAPLPKTALDSPVPPAEAPTTVDWIPLALELSPMATAWAPPAVVLAPMAIAELPDTPLSRPIDIPLVASPVTPAPLPSAMPPDSPTLAP